MIIINFYPLLTIHLKIYYVTEFLFILQSILAPFTDLHYRHNPDTPETHLR